MIGLPIDLTREKDRQLVLDRLKSLLASIEAGDCQFYEHSYSTDLNKGRYRFIFGIEPIVESLAEAI